MPVVQYGADLLFRPPRSRFFFSAVILQALLNTTLMILQSKDLQMSTGPLSPCVPIQCSHLYCGKTVSAVLSVRARFFNSVCSSIPPSSMNNTVRAGYRHRPTASVLGLLLYPSSLCLICLYSKLFSDSYLSTAFQVMSVEDIFLSPASTLFSFSFLPDFAGKSRLWIQLPM